MKLIVAETGAPPSPLDQDFGGYGAMMGAMLAAAGAPVDVQVVRVFEQPHPRLPTPSGEARLMITGSPAGVYDPLPWIEPLEEDLRAYLRAGARVVGICFGHQLMTQALGGRVEKSKNGWGVGVHTYTRLADTGPIADGPVRFSCAVSHQDQVIEPPPGAKVLAGSAFCPNGVLSYADGRGLSFQMHPEFSTDFARALLSQRQDRMLPATHELGMASYRGDTDRAAMGKWIADFLFGDET